MFGRCVDGRTMTGWWTWFCCKNTALLDGGEIGTQVDELGVDSVERFQLDGCLRAVAQGGHGKVALVEDDAIEEMPNAQSMDVREKVLCPGSFHAHEHDRGVLCHARRPYDEGDVVETTRHVAAEGHQGQHHNGTAMAAEGGWQHKGGALASTKGEHGDHF